MGYDDTPREGEWESLGRVIPAVALIGVGALFLLGNLHVIPALNWFDFWPVILIAIGLMKLVDAGGRGGYVGGALLLGIGALFLADNLGFLPVPVWQLWPLGLILIGFALLFQRLSWRDRLAGASSGESAPDPAPGELRLTAVFSGGKRKISSPDFRGGTISAVFGGFELDLRQATMLADSAVLRIDAVFGGVEVKIPETWCAVVQGDGVFGGYSDETAHPPMTPQTRRLIVKGGAVFGGVEVKN